MSGNGGGASEEVMADSMGGLFPASLVRKLAESLPAEATPESAVPSYTNRNPAIRWLMFRRLDVIRQMALKALAQDGTHTDLAALDFGCGIGMMIPALAARVDSLYLSDKQLTPARATAQWFDASNVVFVRPDELESRVRNLSLDVVIAADVLEHVDDLATVVGMLRRKLRVGGVLIVSGPTENRTYRCGRRIAGFSGEYHVRSVFEVESGVLGAGLAQEQLRKLPFPIGPTLFRITLWRRLD